MSAEYLSCASCGKPLATPESVCVYCEPQLGDADNSPEGRFKCPCCQARFNRPRKVNGATRRFWLLPQIPRLQCPQCSAFLRDARLPNMPAPLLYMVVASAIIAQFLPIGPWHTVCTLIVTAGMLINMWRWKPRLADSKRFEADKTC